ncbi:MAG: zinc ribbon domain-containing protein [Candidatus Riflebacteria bacterium]|nr:zinc ribbon domain-containing protein [Candidatus Riflebacteria bacterium]
MPLFEFRCAACGAQFEADEDRHAETHPLCPSCGGVSRRLLGGGGGVILRQGNPAAAPAEAGSCRREREGVGCCGSKDFCGQPGSGQGCNQSPKR